MSPPITNLADRRLARRLAGMAEARARLPERLDERRYESGHVWRRYPHEAVVLKVKRMLEL